MYLDADTEIRSKESIMAHKGFLYLEPDNLPDKNTLSLAMSFLKNIESLGFTLDRKALEELATCSSEQIINLYPEVFSTLKHLKGGDVDHHIMYPGFPDQVMEMSESELYFNAFIHYLSNGEYIPEYDGYLKTIQEEKEKVNFVTLSSINEQEFNERLMLNLCSSTSITEREKEDIKWYFQNCDYKPYLPKEIPFKENAILASNELLKQNEKVGTISKYIKTPTDVLRFATALSDGDISLSHFKGFKNFSKPEQKMLLGLLEKTGDNPYELLKHKSEFILLGEKLHPGTKRNKRLYPKTAINFSDLRNEKITNIGAYMDSALRNEDWKTAITFLTTKNSEGIPTYNPGEFATKLDKILRMTPDEHKLEVLNSFKKVADEVKPPTLLRTLANFEHRLDSDKEGRCIIPKGNIAKTKYLEDTREEISSFYCKMVKEIITETLKEKFAEKSPMGNVYIDESVKGYNIPATSRSASDGFHTIERGSSIQIDNVGNYVVPFIHWKEKQGIRLDVDLSIVYYDKDMNTIDRIYYGDLKNEYTAHSGDLVSAKDGASEYVCIDLNKIPEEIKYAAINVHSYTKQSFSEIGECFVGVQHKQYKPEEKFDESATRMKIDLTGGSQNNVPFMIDLKERKMIWVDMPGEAPSYTVNNIHMTGEDTLSKIKAIINKPAISLEELVTINAEARGKIVDSPEKAHIIVTEDISKFSDLELKEDVVVLTPFDRDIINTQLLGEKNIAILPNSVNLEEENKIHIDF